LSVAAAIGVDVGSTTWKAVVIDRHGRILASHVEATHPRIEEQTEMALAALREQAGAGPDLPVGATGYGRKRLSAARTLTEITCHARGCFARLEKPGMLIDIGGQDTKVIRIGDGGDVLDFAMNDKCAAGTGRFLEVILGRLHVPVDEVAGHVEHAEQAVSVSSTCTVFAESEVVSLVARGEPLDGILKGLHLSLSSRVVALAGRMADDLPLFMSGGVALNAAMVRCLGESLARPVTVVPDPQLVGALGAALAVVG
jgi:predicted CoA-substrate-specific enzyme activase